MLKVLVFVPPLLRSLASPVLRSVRAHSAEGARVSAECSLLTLPPLVGSSSSAAEGVGRAPVADGVPLPGGFAYGRASFSDVVPDSV